MSAVADIVKNSKCGSKSCKDVKSGKKQQNPNEPPLDVIMNLQNPKSTVEAPISAYEQPSKPRESFESEKYRNSGTDDQDDQDDQDEDIYNPKSNKRCGGIILAIAIIVIILILLGSLCMKNGENGDGIKGIKNAFASKKRGSQEKTIE